MKLIRVLSALGVFICFVLWVSSALAARNASGTYAKLYTFSSGTIINSTNVNSQFSDMETALTDSLDRNGKGGMLAALRGVSGTVTAPAYSWTADTGTGLYAIASSDIGFSINQSKVGEWTANGYRSGNGAVATPSLSFFNDTGSGLYRIGSNDIGFAVNGALKTEWNAIGFGAGGAPTTSLLEVIGSSEPSIEVRNTTMTGSPSAYFGMNNGNSAGLLQIVKTSGSPSLPWKFYTINSGSAVLALTLAAAGGATLASDLTAPGIVTAAEYLCSTYGASATRCGAVSANGSGDATVTIAASMHACICSDATVTTPAATGCNLSGTTLTVKTTALHAINYFCF